MRRREDPTSRSRTTSDALRGGATPVTRTSRPASDGAGAPGAGAEAGVPGATAIGGGVAGATWTSDVCEARAGESNDAPDLRGDHLPVAHRRLERPGRRGSNRRAIERGAHARLDLGARHVTVLGDHEHDGNDDVVRLCVPVRRRRRRLRLRPWLDDVVRVRRSDLQGPSARQPHDERDAQPSGSYRGRHRHYCFDHGCASLSSPGSAPTQVKLLPTQSASLAGRPPGVGAARAAGERRARQS